MILRRIMLGALAAAPALVLACGDDATDGAVAGADSGREAEAPDVAVSPDGDAGTASITLTTRAPSLTTAPGEKTTATWAAARDGDEGAFVPIAPVSAGTYTFGVKRDRFAVVLACATADDASAAVAVHHRTVAADATRDLDVTLEGGCTPPRSAGAFTLTGNLANVPVTTSWLDFGYALDTRGAVLPGVAAATPYEIVNVVPGTWDLAFGLRDAPEAPFSRMILTRNVVITADTTADRDATGGESFAPGAKALLLRGLTPNETVSAKVLYTTGGLLGIDVGPQEAPAPIPDVTTSYSTVPPALQVASDRYRASVTANVGDDFARTLTFTVHDAIDVDLAFPPLLGALQSTIAATSPYVRLTTRVAALPGAATHELRAVTRPGARREHRWVVTFDAAAAGAATELVDTMPDLSSVGGWKNAWALPADENVTVTATAREAPRALGDGTSERATARTTFVAP